MAGASLENPPSSLEASIDKGFDMFGIANKKQVGLVVS